MCVLLYLIVIFFLFLLNKLDLNATQQQQRGKIVNERKEKNAHTSVNNVNINLSDL